jgi:sucrose-6-phosphate hydrolase SacC (GH32 family)
MFSGGGIVDTDNTSGLGDGTNAPMVLFYTAEDSWIQGLAYSQDGRNFKKTDPILSKITDGNRDPKVIWHEPSKRWVMVLYVTEKNDQHSIHFLTSANLKEWELASVFNGGIGDDRYLYECPEFFELPVEGSTEVKKWVLTGANNEYAIGTFDGKVFKPEEERLNGQLGRGFYAPQTFSNEPNGRKIELGWWRTNTSDIGANFNQSMSLPMKLNLIQTPNGIRLTRTPIEELKALRVKQYSFNDLKIPNSETHIFKNVNAELLEIRTLIEPGMAEIVQFTIRGIDLVYNVQKEELSVDGVKAHLPIYNNQLKFVIYVDRIGLEIFSNQGMFFMPVNINIDEKNKEIKVSVKGGDLEIIKMDVYELKSSWK